jgi:hypothetical protein
MINDQNEIGSQTVQPTATPATAAPPKVPFYDPTKKKQYIVLGIVILVALAALIHVL